MKHAIAFLFCLLSILGYSQAYFQQKVHTRISVELNDVDNTLEGHVWMKYINHSPDTLHKIALHLYPNAYSEENTPLGEQLLRNGNTSLYFRSPDEMGRIDGLAFEIDGVAHEFHTPKGLFDVAWIYLEEVLIPGDSILISTPFKVKIPKAGISRMGHFENTYQISQWFPKPAVYDKDGWHSMHYLNQGGFYSEYGNYDVSIRVPVDYRVAASGELLTKSELDWYNELSKDSSELQLDIQHPFKSDSTHKTLHFKVDNVHDFAWFANRNWIVKQETLTMMDEGSVVCRTFVSSDNLDKWKYAMTYLKRSVLFYSENLLDYPYSTISVVEGEISAGSAMEYPCVSIISPITDDNVLETLIAHEVGHNWFYGILGLNERDEPWLDEGLTSLYTGLYNEAFQNEGLFLSDSDIARKLMARNSVYTKRFEEYISYLLVARKNLDLPSGQSSESYNMYNYFALNYFKAHQSFSLLRDYIGEEDWNRILEGFVNEWAYKHPSHSDLESYLKTHFEKDLTWFFDDLLKSNKKMDYALISSKKQKDSTYRIRLRNKGEIQAPVKISALDKKGIVQKELWVDGFRGTKDVVFVSGDYTEFIIDYNLHSIDLNLMNNRIRSKGIVKQLKNPMPSLLYKIPQRDQYSNFVLPALGWNQNDGFMLGGIAYNDWVLEQKWQYYVMPLYAFNTEKVNGSFQAYRNFYPKNKIQRISIGVSGKTYTHDIYDLRPNFNQEEVLSFSRVKGELDIHFKTPVDKGKMIRSLNFSFTQIDKEFTAYYDDAQGMVYAGNNKYGIARLNYNYQMLNAINPHGLKVNAEYYKTQLKLGLDLNYSMKYGKEDRGLDVRIFAGTFLGTNVYDYGDQFRLSNWTGSNDYLFDDAFLSRNGRIGRGLWSQQMYQHEGGFAVSSLLRSNSWIASANFKSTLFIPQLKVYANAAIMPDFYDETKFYGEIGVSIVPIKDVLEIYFPIVYSSQIKSINELNGIDKYHHNIRFVFNINKLNAFDYLRRLKY